MKISTEEKTEMKQANRSFSDMIRRMMKKGALISVTNNSTDMKQNKNQLFGPGEEDDEDILDDND